MGATPIRCKAALHELIDGFSRPAHRQEVSVRTPGLASAGPRQADDGAARQNAGAAPSFGPTFGRANANGAGAIPDGPGKRIAELQGLDKVTAAPPSGLLCEVGEATRFGHARAHRRENCPGERARKRGPEYRGLHHHHRPQARTTRGEAVRRWMSRVHAVPCRPSTTGVCRRPR